MKKGKKSMVVILLLFLLLMSMETLAAVPIQTGDYVQMGKSTNQSDDQPSEEKPLLWRCVDAEDPNGPLVMSIEPQIGSSPKNLNDILWEKSGRRQFLNQSYIVSLETHDSSEERRGFLNSFTLSEQRAMRMVPQYTLLAEQYRDLAIDPNAAPYSFANFLQECKPAESGSWLKQVVSDVLFPPGIDQAKLAAERSIIRLDTLTKVFPTFGEIDRSFALRSPYFQGEMNSGAVIYKGGQISYVAKQSMSLTEIIIDMGEGFGTNIHPCFYLNQVTAYAKSGSGTEEDPYVVDTNCTFDDGRIIRIQGANLPYDTPVYEEQGEVMVPLRAIIEALGGSVAWDEATRTVAISCRGVEARVEVDSQKVLVGGEEKWPQATPQLRYDRTYIPFSYLDGVLGLQQPWTTGWEENGQLIELLYASEEQAGE